MRRTRYTKDHFIFRHRQFMAEPGAGGEGDPGAGGEGGGDSGEFDVRAFATQTTDALKAITEQLGSVKKQGTTISALSKTLKTLGERVDGLANTNRGSEGDADG